MPFADVPSELDDGLHALDLTLNIRVEVFFFHLWEAQEVDRASVPCCRVFGDKRPEGLIEVFS